MRYWPAALETALDFIPVATFSACTFAFGTAALHSGGVLRQKMLDAIQQAASRSSDPQAAQAVEFLKTPQGLVLAMILGLILTFVAFVLFSGLGGAIGAALLRRKNVP